MQPRRDMGYGYAYAPPREDADSRQAFLSKTYTHLFLAIAAFAALEIAAFKTGVADAMVASLFASRGLVYALFGGFILVGWGASFVAHRVESKALQYAALAGYVVAEAVIFVPLLWLATKVDAKILPSAALITLAGFAGLTALVMFTGKSFTFLGAILRWAFIVSIVTVIAALVFGLTLGTWFSAAMIALAGASILYTTSRLHEDFPEDRYVGAALELFAAVALMFWYVIRIFLSSRD